MGKTIVMGRKTFESLPRLMPGREHIVLTHNKDYKGAAHVYTDLHNLILMLKRSQRESFIIGGAHMYMDFMPFCSKVYLTRIYKSIPADTYFALDTTDFYITYASPIFFDKINGVQYSYFDFERKKVGD